MVRWKPRDCLTARPSRSAPECGALMMKTGWRTLRPLTTRMCGRGDIATHQCVTASAQRLLAATGAPAVMSRVVFQVQRSLDQRHVTECLRGVPDLAAVPRIVFLAQQPQVAAQRQQAFEDA